eukprot:gene7293-9271_t
MRQPVCDGRDPRRGAARGGAACWQRAGWGAGTSAPSVAGTIALTVRTTTSTRWQADTKDPVEYAFLVDGVWTEFALLFTKSKSGAPAQASARLTAWPTSLKLRIDGNNAWGFQSVAVVDDPTGQVMELANCGNACPSSGAGTSTQWWLDGDSKKNPVERTWNIPEKADVTTQTSDDDLSRLDIGGRQTTHKKTTGVTVAQHHGNTVRSGRGSLSAPGAWDSRTMKITHYWDCSGQGCDSTLLQPWDPSKYISTA